MATAVADPPPGDVATPPAAERIAVELNELCGHVNAMHGRLVDLTVELLADGSWFVDGIHSPANYLCWRTGLSPARAREIVAIAERVAELPVCIEALRRGELAIDQMAAIARRAPWWIDQEIFDLGRMLNVTQLRRLLDRYPFPDVPFPGTDTDVEPTVTEPTAAASRDRLSCGVGDDGRWRLNVECDQLTGMIIDRALDEARDELFNAGDTGVTMVDALRELAERSLDSISSPERRDRFRINLHIDTDANATDALGWRLPDAIRRHLGCDGLLTATFIAGGLPLSVGRTQRIIPERTRRFVVWRDQGCRVPGCNVTHHLEVHHIAHWEELGPTETWNLICLCPRHHRLHHQGELGIAGNADDPDGISFTRRDGRPLHASGAKPLPPGAPPPTPAGVYQPPLGERLDMDWIHFPEPE